MKWEKVEIGDILTLQRGFDITKSEQKQGEYPVVSSSGIQSFHNDFKVAGEGVVIGRKGSLGTCFFLKQDFWAHDTTLFVKDFKGNHRRFIYYFLKNLNLASLDVGSSNPTLNRNHVHKIKVSFTNNIPTQRKIANILSAYDDLIENNLKRIKLLEEKARLEYNLILIESEESNKINLYDFANIQMGFPFKADAFNENGEGIPIIRIRDIPNQVTKSFTTEEVSKEYFVEKGDLLIGMDGEFHMNEWLGQKGYLVQRVCRLRTKNPLYQSYLWQALIEPIKYYENTISGATVAHLGKKHLEEIKIILPNKLMESKLSELNYIRQLKINLAEQNTKLREARDILLPRLMNGEITV
ncbi:MAG: restriction endonuclease subunit S [Leptospiraceae bacterium]|nr:restriction endonuclease subunit S [Leptospiraceae bacterium]MBL0264425.1 restriction endonuclease subunit S [Leptospiraceae bacterium]